MFNASTLWPLGFLLMATFLGKVGWPLITEVQVSLFYKFLTIFHYLGSIIILMMVFAYFASWYSLIVQKLDIQFPEGIGRIHFWVTLIGATVMYLPGYLIEMPRRITADPTPVIIPFFTFTNALGICLIGLGFAIFLYGLYKALAT